MLAADRRAVDSDLQAQAVQIKNIEMQNIDRYLQSIATQAALIAGFASSVLLCDSLILFAEDEGRTNFFLQAAYYGTTTCCLVLEFYCVMNSTLVSVFGPTYALNGPSGSMHTAVASMKEERLTILFAFGMGSFFFGLSQIFVGWIIMPSFSAVMCTLIVLLGFMKTYFAAHRVMARFKVVLDERQGGAKGTNKDCGECGAKPMKANAYLSEKKRSEDAKKVDFIVAKAAEVQVSLA